MRALLCADEKALLRVPPSEPRAALSHLQFRCERLQALHMTPDSTAINSVLYTLSTIAQTCAALAALVGALALYKLQAMRERHADEETNIRGLVRPFSTEAAMLETSELITRATRISEAAHSSDSDRFRAKLLAAAVAEFKGFASRHGHALKRLIAFEAWNLFAIFAALIGFSFASWLASHWAVFVIALVILSVGTVGVTGGALYVMAQREPTRSGSDADD